MKTNQKYYELTGSYLTDFTGTFRLLQVLGISLICFAFMVMIR